MAVKKVDPKKAPKKASKSPAPTPPPRAMPQRVEDEIRGPLNQTPGASPVTASPVTASPADSFISDVTGLFATPTTPTAPEGPDARNTLNEVLSRYGLSDLSAALYKMYTDKTMDISNEASIMYAIRNEPSYQKRFAANAVRVARGLPELSPETYIRLEDSYREILQTNGMAGMYSKEDFAKLIGGDVGVSEFNDRINYARGVMMDSPAEVRNQMQTLYGITEGQILGYFIDPSRGSPFLKEQEKAARIAAAAKERANMQLTGSLATNLAKRNITEEQANTAFETIGQGGEIFKKLEGEDDLTQEQLVGATLGYDPDALKKVKDRALKRISQFKGGGGYTQAQSGNTGLGSPE